MSAISSLTIWSSIKIPHPGRSYRKRNEIKPIPYVSSWEKIGNSAKITQEVVNLRVPYPLRAGKENSAPDSPYLFQDVYKKKSGKNRINCLRVPEVPELETGQNQDFLQCYCSVHGHIPCCEPSFYDDLWQNSNSDKILGSDDEKGFDGIPSIKPCTAEELRMVKERYHLREKKSKAKKKNKQRIKMTQSDPTNRSSPKKINLDYSKSRNGPNQKSCYEDCDVRDINLSYSSALSSGMKEFYHQQRKEYYEGRLAELYLIELGIK